MAGKDINIPITGDANDFIRETGDVEDALKDVSDALDDMARDTKKGGKDAEKAVDHLADSFDDARKAAKKAGEAGEDAGRDIEKGMDRAEEGVSEFKDEANSTAREAAASFDGSAESIADMFQEVAANAFAGFGPAGAVAGLAAAAGIGMAVAGFEATQEAQAQTEENIAGWADKYIEAGNRIIGASAVVAEVQAIATDPERYKVAAENAKNWGVDASTAMLAMAGDASALGIVTAQVTERQEEWGRILRETTTGSGNSWDKSSLTQKQQEYGSAVIRGVDALKTLNGEMSAGAARADEVSAAYRALIDNASDATIQVDDLGNQIVTLPDDTQIFIDALTGQASRNVDRFKGDLNEIPATKAVTVNGTVDMSQVTNGIRNYRAPQVYIPGRIVDRYGKEMF